MPTTSYLQRRPSGYSYRRRVPNSLLPALQQREIIVSLKTNCPRTANIRMGSVHVAVNSIFEKAGYMKGALSYEQADAIAENWKRRTLNEDFEARLGGTSSAAPLAPTEIAQELEVALKQLSEIKISSQDQTIQKVSQTNDLQIEQNTTSWHRLGYSLLKANVDLLQELKKRAAPEIPHPMAFMPEESSSSLLAPDITITEALAGWVKEGDQSPNTIQEWHLWIRRFTDLHSDLTVRRITVAHVRTLKEEALKCPINVKAAYQSLALPDRIKAFEGKEHPRLSKTSVNKGLSAISSVLSWCVQNGYLETNPASGLQIRISKVKTAQKKRLPFDTDDLKSIFHESPVFKEGKRPRGGAGHACYWIPILALYTGARLEEMGQLQANDAKCAFGIWYLNITTTSEEDNLYEDNQRSVKTVGSLRKIPIHQDVLDLGFLDYVNDTKKQHKDLFPFVQSKGPKRTPPFSKWFNRYLRTKCSITDKRKVFHSFRHTFIDACRDAVIPEEIRDTITGHVGKKTMADTYGLGYKLKIMNEAIQTINYSETQVP